MHEQSMTINLEGRDARSVIIGRGAHGTIELDPSSSIVSKRFGNPATAEAAELAQREFDYLKRFSAALASQQFLGCPEPLSMEPESATVRMTYCPGVRLDHLLASSRGSVGTHLDHFADQIALAVEIYINEFQEPFYDLATYNMLYHMPTRRLYLVDFASPEGHFSSLQNDFVEITLGRFIGRNIYDTVRLANLKNREYWKLQARLSEGVIKRLSIRHHLRLSLIQQVSTHRYQVRGRKGGTMRQLWYATVGQALFNRRNREVLAGPAVGGTS
jgi:hypothetical protein